jgi:hypothetical protein
MGASFPSFTPEEQRWQAEKLETMGSRCGCGSLAWGTRTFGRGRNPAGIGPLGRGFLNQRRLGVYCEAASLAGCFAELIIRTHEASGQRVVILVDGSRSSCSVDRPRRSSFRLSIQTGDNPALTRLRARDDSAKYRDLPNQGLLEVGLVFDRQARNLVRADWVKLGESRG